MSRRMMTGDSVVDALRTAMTSDSSTQPVMRCTENIQAPTTPMNETTRMTTCVSVPTCVTAGWNSNRYYASKHAILKMIHATVGELQSGE